MQSTTHKKPRKNLIRVRTHIKAGPSRIEFFGDPVGNYNMKAALTIDEDGFIIDPN